MIKFLSVATAVIKNAKTIIGYVSAVSKFLESLIPSTDKFLQDVKALQKEGADE